jgi:predicted nucleotidyltransferase
MDIKYGDIEYFTLVDLSDKLKNIHYNKLDLVNLDKLKLEIDMKIQKIHNDRNEYLKNRKSS